MEFKFTLERDESLEVTVKGEYDGGSLGHRDRLGVPEEPDEPEGLEIESVTDDTGNEVEITDAEYAAINDHAINMARESQYDYDPPDDWD